MLCFIQSQLRRAAPAMLLEADMFNSQQGGAVALSSIVHLVAMVLIQHVPLSTYWCAACG